MPKKRYFVRLRSVVDRIVAQLSISTTAPTFDVAVIKDGAGVDFSTRHRNGRSTRAKVNRCGWRCVGFSDLR